MGKTLFSFILLCSLNALGADDFQSFTRELNQTLHYLNHSKNGPCNRPSLTAVKTSKRMSLTAQNNKKTKEKASVLSEKEAQQLFRELKANGEIPFEFSIAGCEERAHEMSRLMLLKGITPLKVFASVDENQSSRLRRPHPTKQGTTVEWKYHVAPVILVKKGSEVVPYVLDPSLESKAVPVSEWKRTMTQHDPKMKVQLHFTPAAQYDEQGRIVVNFKDNDFNASIKQTLLDHKTRSQNTDGEDNLWFQLQRDEERMMIMDGY